VAAPAATVLPAEPLRYAGRYRDGVRLVNVTSSEGLLTLRPGLRRPESRLVAGLGGSFTTLEDPSIELRFHVQDDEVRGYSRYHNGWFLGVAVRSDDQERLSR
jgi:hypothetical protein